MVSPSDEIYAVLVQKTKAFDEFLSVTMLLRHALENDEIMAVNQLIQRRVELIMAVDEIDRRINDFRQSEQSVKGSTLTQQKVKMCERIRERLIQITSLNQECNAIAAKNCDILKKEMEAIHQNEEALHVYAGKTQGISKFLSVRT